MKEKRQNYLPSRSSCELMSSTFCVRDLVTDHTQTSRPQRERHKLDGQTDLTRRNDRQAAANQGRRETDFPSSVIKHTERGRQADGKTARQLIKAGS